MNQINETLGVTTPEARYAYVMQVAGRAVAALRALRSFTESFMRPLSITWCRGEKDCPLWAGPDDLTEER